MATIVISPVTRSGVAPTFAAATAGGDTFANDGQTVLDVNNASGGSITVTVIAVAKCNQGSLHNAVETVLTLTHGIIGPFPVARFGRIVSVTYSAVTTVTVAAYDYSS